MQIAAGVTATRDDVQAGHQVVRAIATSGTPVPPAPIQPPPRPPQAAAARNPSRRSRPAQGSQGGSRSGQGAGRREWSPRAASAPRASARSWNS